MIETTKPRTSVIMLLKSRDDDVHFKVVTRVWDFNNFLSSHELTLELLSSFLKREVLLCLVKFLSLCIWYASLVFIFSDNFTHDKQRSFWRRFPSFFNILLRCVICDTLSFRYRPGNLYTTWIFRTLPWRVRLLFKFQGAISFTWTRGLSFMLLSANRCINPITLSIW